jgi:hypothetical protein
MDNEDALNVDPLSPNGACITDDEVATQDLLCHVNRSSIDPVPWVLVFWTIRGGTRLLGTWPTTYTPLSSSFSELALSTTLALTQATTTAG